MEANFIVTEFAKKMDPQSRRVILALDLVRTDKGKAGLIQLRGDEFFEVDTGDEFSVLIVKKKKADDKKETV